MLKEHCQPLGVRSLDLFGAGQGDMADKTSFYWPFRKPGHGAINAPMQLVELLAFRVNPSPDNPGKPQIREASQSLANQVHRTTATRGAAKGSREFSQS